jgi:cyclopropane-fatty-acyl-phospholipid synthase
VTRDPVRFDPPSVGSRAPKLLGGLFRRAVLARLDRLRVGRLTIEDAAGSRDFGSGDPPQAPRAVVRVLDARFYAAVALGGARGAGEAYVNRAALEAADGVVAKARAAVERAVAALSRNTRARNRRDVEAHYDLGNDFYALWLDPTWSYSCAIFERPDMTLEEASIAKFERICRRLEISRSDVVVEIGTGWGGFAAYAAKTRGCRVRTTTISPSQHAYAVERMRREGVADRVEVLLRDYRDLDGAHDKLVSIEMIEAVGADAYEEYFAACARLLKPEGRLLIQAIVIDERFYERALLCADFIRARVFPGSAIPSIGALHRAMTRASDLRLLGLDDLSRHYAPTLRAWRERFLAREKDVRALGFDSRFLRKWEYYLAYCEGGFAERALGDVHLLAARAADRR